MRKATILFMTGILALSSLAGCGTANTSTKNEIKETSKYSGNMTLIVPEEDEYLTTLEQASVAKADELGITLTAVQCSNNVDKQIEYVQAANENGENAIMIVLSDDQRAEDIIRAAGDMKVVFVNRIPADGSLLDENHIYVGSDESTSGVFQGELLAEELKAAGKTEIHYIMLQGTEGLLHTTARSNGVISSLEKEGITATPIDNGVINCDYSRETAIDTITEMVNEGLDMSTVDAIISNNDAMALGAIEALEQADIDISNLFIVGTDGTADALEAIKDGKMTATVFQNADAQGSIAVQAAINLAIGADIDAETDFEAEDHIIWIPFKKINSENLSTYLK